MTEHEALAVLCRHGFFGYMGPGYRTGRAVSDFMTSYPRGKGIRKGQDDLREVYMACRAYAVATSRTRNWKPPQAA